MRRQDRLIINKIMAYGSVVIPILCGKYRMAVKAVEKPQTWQLLAGVTTLMGLV